MSLFFRLLKKRRCLVLSSIAASGLTAAVTLWWNTQLSGIINNVSAGIKLTGQTVSMALITMIVTGVTNYIKGYISGYTCESLSHDLRMGYARYFSLLPFAEAEKTRVGEQLSRLQNEIADISAYINNNLFQLLDDGVMFIATLIWLIFMNPVLTITVYSPVLLIMAYVFYASRIISSATASSQQARGRMNGQVETLLTLFPVLKLYEAANMFLSRYRDDVAVWERETVRSERTRARLMSPSGFFSTSIPLIILFLVGGRLVFNGTLAIGTLYIFINLSGNVSGVMMNMPGYIAAFRHFAANIKRVSPRVLTEVT